MKQYSLKITGNITRKESFGAILVVVVYSVGVAGITIPFTNALFIRLIPVVIVLSLAADLFFHKPYDIKTVAVFSSITAAAWIIEAVGVNTGVIFGNYSYGTALGIRIAGTPLLIGLNWLLLIYGSAALTGGLNFSNIYKVFLASVAMVAFDLVLETLAPQMNMWRFDAGTAPAMNYLSWFLVSLIFHSFLRLAGIRVLNPVAKIIFVVQFAFFLLISVLLHLK